MLLHKLGHIQADQGRPALLNRSSASCFTSSVLPTPVEPTKMKRHRLVLGAEMPTRLRRMAADTACDGLVLPDCMWLLEPLLQLAPGAGTPSSWIWLAGIFVHSSMTRAMLSMVSWGVPLARMALSSSVTRSSWLRSSAMRS